MAGQIEGGRSTDGSGPGAAGPSTPEPGAAGRSTPESGATGPGQALPDFRGGTEGAGGQAGERARGGLAGGSAPSRPDGGHPPRELLLAGLGGCGLLLILLVVVALVLWNTVLSPSPEQTPTTAPTTEESSSPSEHPGEYVPGEDDEPLTGGSPTLTSAPTRPCTIHDGTTRSMASAGTVRGGGIEYDLQEGWSTGIDWGTQESYMVDLASSEQAVEDGWYSVATVGGVEFPAEEGGYPGAQEAARTIFQCDVTRDVVRDLYVDPLEVQDLRDEAITIDGQDAWIVAGTVPLAADQNFGTTDSWDLVVIVVDAPQGPAALVAGAATGIDQQVADLEAIVASLAVVD